MEIERFLVFDVVSELQQKAIVPNSLDGHVRRENIDFCFTPHTKTSTVSASRKNLSSEVSPLIFRVCPMCVGCPYLLMPYTGEKTVTWEDISTSLHYYSDLNRQPSQQIWISLRPAEGLLFEWRQSFKCWVVEMVE